MSAVMQKPPVLQLPPNVGQLPPMLPPGATAPRSHSNFGNILKNVVIFGGLGAAAGFGLSVLPLPFLGFLTGPIGAIAGGVLGAGIGLLRALHQNRQGVGQASVGMSLLPPR